MQECGQTQTTKLFFLSASIFFHFSYLSDSINFIQIWFSIEIIACRCIYMPPEIREVENKLLFEVLIFHLKHASSLYWFHVTFPFQYLANFGY